MSDMAEALQTALSRPPVARVRYSGFWRRVLAAIIDGTLIGGVSYGTSGGEFESGSWLVSTVIGWLYGALMESSSKQATLGKMVVGVIVTDLEGKRISIMRATGRHFAKWISAIILGIGFLMVAFTKKKQGLHDILADTLVVKVN